jgi:hypothetical protein
VTQELLDDPQVGAAVEEVRGERVPQGVRGRIVRQARPQRGPVQPVADPAGAKRGPPVIDEEGIRGARPLAGAGKEDGAAVDEVRPPSADRAGRPRRPIRSLRPLPTTRISPRARSRAPRRAPASSEIRRPPA